jgi:hypothetical protein
MAVHVMKSVFLVMKKVWGGLGGLGGRSERKRLNGKTWVTTSEKFGLPIGSLSVRSD